MRIIEIRYRLKNIKPMLKIKATRRNSSPQTYLLVNVLELQKVINEIEKINVFSEHIEQLKKLSFYSYTQDNLVIQVQEYNLLSKVINELDLIIKGIISTINLSFPIEDDNVIRIKLPEPKNFEDIEKASSTLNKVFSQTLLHKNINGNIKILRFDTGSFWIDIVVNGITVLNLIAGLAYSAAVVYKKIQEGKFTQEKVKALKISNKAFQEIVEKYNEKIEDTAKNEAELIMSEFYKEKDPEQISRIKLAIKELSSLFEHGAEIYPSLEAKKEIKELFPNLKQIETIESRIKRLPKNEKK